MPIAFVNEKSGERVLITREPQVAAFVNSSNLSINASQGQDMGWRLSPDVIVRIDDMRSDPQLLNRIAQERGILAQDLKTQHFITEILRQDAVAEQMRMSEINENPIHREAYEAELRALREAKAGKKTAKSVPVVDQSDAPAVVAVKSKKKK